MDLSSNETPLVPQAEEIICSECLLLQTTTVPRLSNTNVLQHSFMLICYIEKSVKLMINLCMVSDPNRSRNNT